jgi:WD40 repeat protein
MTTAPRDSWTVAIHRTAKDDRPIGTGVVVDRTHVLTCEHVLRQEGRMLDEVYLAFPKALGVAWDDRRRVRGPFHQTGAAQHIDVALLQLEEPVPQPVEPARLRCLPPAALAGRQWWAFGFPLESEQGGSAEGNVGDPLAWGCVYLDRQSTPGLAGGFSGSALWSPDYDAVVGLVMAATPAGAKAGDGHALTLFHADQQLPELKLSTLAGWQAQDADDAALAAWGWVLTSDDEARRHWLPRARGVASDAEHGSRFRGRTTALRRLRSWLDAPEQPDRVLVVTGSPGVGKSAVLGRIVTTADRAIQDALPPGDDAVRAVVGSVSCAVHAKGKTALEIAAEIARAASVSLPTAPADLMPALRERLSHRPDRFNLIIDALDEAASPAQTRALIGEVVLPLVRHLSALGVRIVVGTRRTDDRGDLLAEFGTAEIIDLDTPAYFAESDLADYALVTLQLVGAERPGNPYRTDEIAVPVARRIAALSHGNFLVAGLVARARGLRDTEPIRPDLVSFAATVADALDRYVDGLPAAGWTPARLALTALAYAETPGLPVSLWRIAIEALGGTVSDGDLAAFARTSAANFLVETGGASTPTYRLFHQALNDALLDARDNLSLRTDDERRLVSAWLGHATGTGWATAPEYLLRSLPGHAARAGLIDDVLSSEDYVLHAHLDRLLPAAESALTELGKARAQLLQRTPLALHAGAPERAALFSVVEKLDRLDSRMRPYPEAPYIGCWARTPPRLERMVLEGHLDAVHDVASIVVDGRTLLASAGEDGKARLWDPLTSETTLEIDGHDACIRGLGTVRVGSISLLATASHDTTVKLWDPRTGQLIRTLHGHTDWVRNLCPVTMPDGRELLASASDDRTVRLWNPADGTLVRTMTGHLGWVTAVCHLPTRYGGMLASTGFDGTIRVWNPNNGMTLQILKGHEGWVTTLCAVRTPAGVQIASAGYDGTVRLWDPTTGAAVRVLDAGTGLLTDVCTLAVDGLLLLAATGEDGLIRLWDVATGIQLEDLEGHISWIRAICELTVGERNLLATAGSDGTVRLWDARTGRPEAVMEESRLGSVDALVATGFPDGPLLAVAAGEGAVLLLDPFTGEQRQEIPSSVSSISALCAFDDGTDHVLATASADTVRTWDLLNEEEIVSAQVHFDSVNAVHAFSFGGRVLLASAADDMTVRTWDPVTGVESAAPRVHPTWVTALAVVDGPGPALLASADSDGTIRLWDPAGGLVWQRPGFGEGVNALSVVRIGDRGVLVSAGVDRLIRLWNPADGTSLGTLAGHTAPITGVCAASLGGRPIIASTSLDRTVRLWDLATGRAARTIPVYHRALACCFVDDLLVVGLDRGLLALTLR